VYVAAFAPDVGETINQFNDPAQYPGSALTPDALVFRPYPRGVDVTIAPARFQRIFAADLPSRQTRLMAAAQDKAISPVAQRFLAERIGAHTTTVDASHVGYISHPSRTANLIESAARATH
jgi:hypothetical protein